VDTWVTGTAAAHICVAGTGVDRVPVEIFHVFFVVFRNFHWGTGDFFGGLVTGVGVTVVGIASFACQTMRSDLLGLFGALEAAMNFGVVGIVLVVGASEVALESTSVGESPDRWAGLFALPDPSDSIRIIALFARGSVGAALASGSAWFADELSSGAGVHGVTIEAVATWKNGLICRV